MQSKYPDSWGKKAKRTPIVERNGRTYKVCARCKVEKISTDFGYANPYLKRLFSYCNQCRREYDKQRRIAKKINN